MDLVVDEEGLEEEDVNNDDKIEEEPCVRETVEEV